MGFARQEYWSGLLFPSPTQGLNLCFLHWQVDSLPLSHQEDKIAKKLHIYKHRFFLNGENYSLVNIKETM